MRRNLRDPNWIDYQLMWGKRMNLNLSWVLIYKKLQIISLFQIRQKLERKSSEEHIYTLLPGKTQPKSENKSMPLPDQTQQNSEDPPLSDNTKNWRLGCQTNKRIHLFQLGLKQSQKISLCLFLLRLNRSLMIKIFLLRRQYVNVRGVRFTIKRTPLLSIIYLDIS